eukprot:TRINITY_DN8718_c0_g2_i6.p1 TRINITY_DN8718_c0_g2~~TRINITY_DN8718_c0_g2_i6.p1  ORF type:complete len:134 (+),score=18.70 TRINITY_DN8718_c0_g2_i6:80-481(+)
MCIRDRCSLPYELNLKANTLLQISESFQLSYFKPGAVHKKHLDSSFQQDLDTGRTLSALLFVFDVQTLSAQRPNIKIFCNAEAEGMEHRCATNQLFILKSRVIPYEIQAAIAPFFILRFFINGPAVFDDRRKM